MKVQFTILLNDGKVMTHRVDSNEKADKLTIEENRLMIKEGIELKRILWACEMVIPDFEYLYNDKGSVVHRAVLHENKYLKIHTGTTDVPRETHPYTSLLVDHLF